MSIKSDNDIIRMRAQLLDWYDAQGRELPWRVRPEDRTRGIDPDPYAVWLSEIMCQQTTIAHATPYWLKFLSEFPTVTDLARAERDHVLSLWAGLGYYARARNLHKCANVVHETYDGRFPTTEAELLKLPGIGPYTAATIAAICFDEPTTIVDGNVERVITRIFTVQTPLPKAKPEIKRLAACVSDPERPGDYGQALMDLGATICTPTSPKCTDCVWSRFCNAHATQSETEYPKKIKKAKLPTRFGDVFVVMTQEHILLERRPDTGLLGGMMGFPGSDWQDFYPEPLKHAPMKADWSISNTPVLHVFTHFKLELRIHVAHLTKRDMLNVIDQDLPDNFIWAPLKDITSFALPSVMIKVLKHATRINNEATYDST